MDGRPDILGVAQHRPDAIAHSRLAALGIEGVELGVESREFDGDLHFGERLAVRFVNLRHRLPLLGLLRQGTHQLQIAIEVRLGFGFGNHRFPEQVDGERHFIFAQAFDGFDDLSDAFPRNIFVRQGFDTGRDGGGSQLSGGGVPPAKPDQFF